MASQPEDNKTKQLFDDEDKVIIGDALKAYSEKIARKAAADGPRTIKELWRAELAKIEAIARKVLS